MKLYFLGLTLCLISLVRGQWPCPAREDISPCICIYNEEDDNPELELDCSVVHSEAQLRNSFDQPYSFTDFYILSLRIASNGVDYVDAILCETLGDLTFQYIDISGTNITEIEENAFENSAKTLKSLVISWNKLESLTIPFEDFDNLKHLELNNNHLANISVDSNSIKTLFLDYNNLTQVDLINLRNVVYLDLSNNYLTEVPDLTSLQDVEVINLENNLIDYIWSDSFKFDDDEMEIVNLNLKSNRITNIEKDAFQYISFDEGSSLVLSGNAITTLDKSNWKTLIEDSIDEDAIGVLDLTDNPLLCGCDIEWLISDEDLLQKIHSETTCNDGTYLKTIDEDILSEFCDR